MYSTTHNAKLVFGDESRSEMYQIRFDAGSEVNEDQMIKDALTEFAARGQSHIKYLWTFRQPQH